MASGWRNNFGSCCAIKPHFWSWLTARGSATATCSKIVVLGQHPQALASEIVLPLTLMALSVQHGMHPHAAFGDCARFAGTKHLHTVGAKAAHTEMDPFRKHCPFDKSLEGDIMALVYQKQGGCYHANSWV